MLAKSLILSSFLLNFLYFSSPKLNYSNINESTDGDNNECFERGPCDDGYVDVTNGEYYTNTTCNEECLGGPYYAENATCDTHCACIERDALYGNGECNDDGPIDNSFAIQIILIILGILSLIIFLGAILACIKGRRKVRTRYSDIDAAMNQKFEMQPTLKRLNKKKQYLYNDMILSSDAVHLTIGILSEDAVYTVPVTDNETFHLGERGNSDAVIHAFKAYSIDDDLIKLILIDFCGSPNYWILVERYHSLLTQYLSDLFWMNVRMSLWCILFLWLIGGAVLGIFSLGLHVLFSILISLIVTKFVGIPFAVTCDRWSELNAYVYPLRFNDKLHKETLVEMEEIDEALYGDLTSNLLQIKHELMTIQASYKRR